MTSSKSTFQSFRFSSYFINQRGRCFRQRGNIFLNIQKLFLNSLVENGLFTNKVFEHDFKFIGGTSSIVVGVSIGIAIIRRIRPIIVVTTKIIPIGIVVEIVVSNEVHINFLFLSNQRG